MNAWHDQVSINQTILDLHQEAKLNAEHYRKAENYLIDNMIRLDELKAFIAFGYASLYEYCLHELKLSESQSSALITVSRKVRVIPKLKEEIASGQLTLSKVQKMTAVLTPENADLWINKAKTLTHKALEKEVAREKPEVLVPVGSRYVSAERLALQLCISEEFMEQLQRLQDILSQRKRASVTLEKSLEACVGEYLERHDLVAKAERAKNRAKKKEKHGANLHFARNVEPEEKVWLTFNAAVRREALEQSLKHDVMQRDRGRCTHIYANGRRCKERRFLEIHHIRPVSHGGEDRLENLTLLCSAHHKHRHFHWERKHGFVAVNKQQSLLV